MFSVNGNSGLPEFSASSDVAPEEFVVTHKGRVVAQESDEELPATYPLEQGVVDTDEFGVIQNHKRLIQRSLCFANLDWTGFLKLKLHILEACEQSDIPELKKLHSAGLNVSLAFSIDGFQEFDPLHHAAETNNKELYLFLLDIAGASDDFEARMHFHIRWLIQYDKVEFIQLLEDRKLLSDDYHIIYDCRRPVPMINIAINDDAAQVIEWLLGRNVDLTKIVYIFPDCGLHKISGRNAFGLALYKMDLTLLHKLLLNFAGDNANTKSLPVTFWVESLAYFSGVDDFAKILEILKNFQNFQEIMTSVLGSACDNIEMLEFLLCKFSKTIFFNLENMQLSQLSVMIMLGVLANRVISEYSIDHLQMLIQKRLPDPEGVNWLLDCCFEYSNADPQFPECFKQVSATTWLIRACIHLGAEITTAEYRPALLAIKEDETPCQKSLVTRMSDMDLKDSRESHVVPERSSYKEVDERLEQFFDAVLTKAINGRERAM